MAKSKTLDRLILVDPHAEPGYNSPDSCHLDGAFEALPTAILPQLLERHSAGSPVRVWVPGCGSGLEAYSIAICLVEAMAKLGMWIPIRVFGTDLSESAVRIARMAVYSRASLGPLTPERLSRFFLPVDDGFQVIAAIRDQIIFAGQDLLVDPPISRIDLISCGHVLNALDPAGQRHAVAALYYALLPQGFLLVRAAESLTGFPELFEAAGQHRRYYVKRSGAASALMNLVPGKVWRKPLADRATTHQELRRINEQLETSREELESANEELNTLNDELQNRNAELSGLSGDLSNLLTSTTIPIVMLDRDLRIRRFTTAAGTLLNVHASDIGRPLRQSSLNLNLDTIEKLLQQGIDASHPGDLEVQAADGCWYMLRTRPCRTPEGRVNGVVMFLVDIDQVRCAERAANGAREFAESVVKSLQTPLLVLRGDLRVRMANIAFFEAFGLQPDRVVNRILFEVDGEVWKSPVLQTALEHVNTGQSPLVDLQLEVDKKTFLLNARLVQRDGERQMLVAVEDITRQKQAEQILKQSVHTESVGRKKAETALHESEAALLQNRGELRALTADLLKSQGDERRRLSRELHDDLSQKVAKLQFDVETLEHQLPAEFPRWKEGLLSIRDEVGALSNDIRRIAYQLHPSSLDHLGLSVALRSLCSEFAEREKLEVKFAVRKVPRQIPPDIASSLYRVAQEGLRNVAKHSGTTAVNVTLTGSPDRLVLTIRDNGSGFDLRSVKGKGGLGLISMQERVRLVNGEFQLKTRPGHGVAITIQVPLL